MHRKTLTPYPVRTWGLLLFVGVACVLLPRIGVAQGLTGALIGTVKDAQGGVLPGAVVRVSSPALIGGPATHDHEREGPTALPRSASGTVRARHRVSGIRDLSRRGHPHRRRRHDRENGGPEAGRRRGIGRGRGSGLAHRSARPRIRDSLRPRGSQGDPDATGEHVRLHQGRSRDLAHVAGERHGDHRVRVRLRHQREPVSHRRHELHLPVQRRRASRAGHRLHSGNAGPVRRGVRRVRQRSGRRHQRRHQAGKRAVSVRRLVLRADRRPDQPAGPTRHSGSGQRESGYERARYRDFTTNLGGPVVRDRLWFFAGYQYLRDYDSQPAPIRRSRGPTSRTRSSRSSRGGWLRAGSWFRAFTTSSGSTPNNRRS